MADPLHQGAQQSDAASIKRKPMRKGTRSCTQCRKRKRRCVYKPSHVACLPCSLRGSACIDQREAAVGADQREHGPLRTSYREACSRDKVSGSPGCPSASSNGRRLGSTASTTCELESEDLEADLGVRPPMAPVLNNGQEYSWVGTGLMNPAGTAARASHWAHVCKELRSALPSYDEIVEALSHNGDWWESFRQKTRAISQAEPVEPLLSFTAHAYTSDNPAVLGTLAIGYGRSLGRASYLFGLVERIVLADSAMAATVQGMECLILLGKTYTDIGQPKRAWLTWRKGLAHAQLMGLHRLTPNDQGVRQRIWWAVYHGDRFTSLLLGLPHGFNDSLFDALMHQTKPSADDWLPSLIHRSVAVAGKVIDANMSTGEKSLAKAMLLDEEMNAAYNCASADWWVVPDELPFSNAACEQLVTQLLIQLFFFHVKMYIFLPFVASLKMDRNPPLSSGGRLACMEAARQLLIRYLVLRTKTETGRVLFDCKTTDFVGFTAALVLLMGSTNSSQPPVDVGTEDMMLVMRIKIVLGTIADSSRCRITSQCRQVLGLLMDPPQTYVDGEETKIVVPYFGTLTRVRRSVDDNNSGYRENSLRPVDTQQPTGSDDCVPLDVGYQGFSMEELTWGSSWGTSDSTQTLVVDDVMGSSLSHAMFDFDLDQDWNLLL